MSNFKKRHFDPIFTLPVGILGVCAGLLIQPSLAATSSPVQSIKASVQDALFLSKARDWQDLAEKNPFLTPAEKYNPIYPLYVESCTVTQFRQYALDKPGCLYQGDPREIHLQSNEVIKACVDIAGFGGHATFFLNGACKDSSETRFPKLKLCGPEVDLSDPDSGVGISVNQVFANVNWAVFPGRNFFFRGGLSPDQILDRETFDQFVRKVVDSGLFEGIQMHESVEKKRPAGMSSKEWLVRNSVGTDFALSFGRSALCERMPVNRAVLSKMVDYLNVLNEKYALGDRAYQWNLLRNNCAHVPHNTYASVGASKFKMVDPEDIQDKVNTRNLSFPGNHVVRVGEWGNLERLDQPHRLFADGETETPLMLYDWIKTRHGVLIDFSPVHPREQNLVFMPGRDPLLIHDVSKITGWLDQLPILNIRNLNKGDIRNILWSQSEFADLSANLDYFEKVYENALQTRKLQPGYVWMNLPFSLGRGTLGRYNDFVRFTEKYLDYLKRQLNDVRKLKTQVRSR